MWWEKNENIIDEEKESNNDGIYSSMLATQKKNYNDSLGICCYFRQIEPVLYPAFNQEV